MKAIKVEMYEATDGNLFEEESKALEYEAFLKETKVQKKMDDLRNKIETLLPSVESLGVNTDPKKRKENKDADLLREVLKIPSHLSIDIDLHCQYSGIALRVYSDEFHDSGHQYEKSYYKRIDKILEKPYKTIKIGDIVRSYSLESFNNHIVPIIEKNKTIIKNYLFYYHTGVI